MTTAQARQAARGPDTQAAAKLPAGPYTAQENHPACPAGTPHGTVHSATGEVIRCHRTPAAAQDLALTLNFPDATPATPGATMVTSAAKGQFRNDLHPRRPDGKFAPKGQGGPARPRTPGQVPRQPATAPARRMGETRPVPPPGPGSPGASPPAADPSLATADLSKLIREQVTAAAAQLTADQHEQLREVQAQLERSQAQLAELHKQESESEEAAKEKRKTVRKLIHHVVALFTVAALTFIGVKTGSLENPMFAGLAATGPLFIQEGLDALKRV